MEKRSFILFLSAVVFLTVGVLLIELFFLHDVILQNETVNIPTFLIAIIVIIVIIIIAGIFFTKITIKPIRTIINRLKAASRNQYSELLPVGNKKGLEENLLKSINDIIKVLDESKKILDDYYTVEKEFNISIFFVNPDLDILTCGSGLSKILEKKRSEIIRKNLRDFIEIDDNIIKNISEGINIPDIEINIGSKRKFLSLRIEQGESKKGFVAALKDVTNEKEEKLARDALEAALIKSNKLAEVGKRVEGIVHNINSPLNTIFGYLQLIRKRTGEDEDIDKILSAAENISHSIKSLLKKTKSDFIPNTRPVDINEVVKQELEQCVHNLFFKHNVVLKTEYTEDLPKARVIHGDISQCVANLLNNAIESLTNRVDKQIFIRTYQTGNLVAFEIRDTGEGIKEENLERIFEPYFSTKTGSEKQGYGLGLSISKDIAEKYLGYITVSSEIGVGSTFTLFLPFSKE